MTRTVPDVGPVPAGAPPSAAEPHAVAPAARRRVPDPPRDEDGAVDLDALVDRLAPADLLEQAGTQPGWAYVIPHAGPELIDDGARTRWCTPDGDRVDLGADPFAAIDRVCAALGIQPGDAHAAEADWPPLTAGLVGALAYDLGRRVERLPAVADDDRDLPHLRLRVVETLIAVAPDRRAAWAVGRDLRGLGALADRLAALADRACGPAPAPADEPTPPSAPRVRAVPDAAGHRGAVAAVLDDIAAGEVFQVNLARRITVEGAWSAHGLYRRLRAVSPAPHGAALPAHGIASISPETFLECDGPRVRTRPIKGTRPRASDPRVDAAWADDLAAAEKDRAENVMVVDLERNDLGRVCSPGTVRVPALCRLEAHPTVWHLVSDVEGRLRDGVGYGELLRATFPCGSITGAPKVAAMTRIERLEPVRRGWYCGAVGFLAPGAARLSVAIRTATCHAGGVDYGAGGGIVADSDPQAEERETLDKAAALLRAVGAEAVAG